MKRALLIEPDDILKILADYFNVTEGDIVKAENAYVVPLGKEGDEG